MQIVVSLFVLIIGEYIIYQIAMNLDLPLIIKVLFIAVIPIAVIAGAIKLIKS